MSTDLIISNSTLPPAMPELNSKHPLATHLFFMTDPLCEGGGYDEKFSSGLREAARAAIEALKPFERPVTQEILFTWCDPIPGVVRNERSPEMILKWLAGLMVAVDGFPCGAFNRSTQKEALQTFQFFPSAADICQVLQPSVSRIQKQMADDEPMRLGGFIPMGDQSRRITQEEVDRAAEFTEPVLRIFKKIPEDLKMGVLSSVVLTWCLQCDDPESALAFLEDQWKQALPALRAARTATRQ
jgi:hypothetical protein